MKISGVGCSVVDIVYSNLDSKKLEKSSFINYAEAIDKESIERRSGLSIEDAIATLTDGVKPTKLLGGVAVATLIGASQIVNQYGTDVLFYNNVSSDIYGQFIIEKVKETPLSYRKMNLVNHPNPLTFVLCDQNKNGDMLNRTFISIRSLDKELAFDPNQFDKEFYNSDINVFSCVQWEPILESNFTSIVKKLKNHGNFIIVGTASDAYGKKDKWTLGDGDQVYKYLDLLIMDKNEAIKYSGCSIEEECLEFFKKSGVGAFVITSGSNPIYACAQNALLYETFEGYIPIATEIDDAKRAGELPIGDGIGCGDNFAGGCVASVSIQMDNDINRKINIVDCCILGCLSGGITSTVKGGTFFEKQPNEKINLMNKYLEGYKQRVWKKLEE